MLIKKIRGIVPKGKASITHAIQITADKIKALDENVTVVLVSDGQETCDGVMVKSKRTMF